MLLNRLEDIFKTHYAEEALVSHKQIYTYQRLLELILSFEHDLSINGVSAGEIVLVSIDYSPKSIALIIALLKRKNIIALVSKKNTRTSDTFSEIVGANHSLSINNGKINFEGKLYNIDNKSNELIQDLQKRGHSGIIIFTSGTTGIPKAALHDTEKFLQKFLRKRYAFRTLGILQPDHVGGLDTLFYTLYNGGTLIIPEDFSPDTICSTIERNSVEVLSASPSFLSMLLLSKVYTKFDLTSLQYITYGGEYMPQPLVAKCAQIFPKVKLLQKYGTTETGTLRSKSESNVSPWVRIGGEEFLTRVVDGKLQIKGDGLMVGYLNAPSPFTEDGWFQTNDLVEEDKGYFRIKGREKDILNIGGYNISISEVEEVLLKIEDIYAATVYTEENILLGNILVAKVYSDRADRKFFREEIRRFCTATLESYKVPSKILFVDSLTTTERMKKFGNNK